MGLKNKLDQKMSLSQINEIKEQVWPENTIITY